MRILIIEDEKKLADSLAQIITKNGYTVDVSYDGEVGEDNALSNIYDLILLDIMLPKKDGFEVLKSIREHEVTTPVILLTARDSVEDKVKGLDEGADDYLPKPFETAELLARIRACLRRKDIPIEDTALHFSDLQLDKQNLFLASKTKQVNLTLKEAEIMEFLILQKQNVSTKEMLLDKVWGFDNEANNNHVEVYVSFLRKKLAFLDSQVIIHTVRGVGYLLKEQDNV